MNRVMILGASILQIPLIKQAREMGCETVVVAPNPDEPGFQYASHSVFADVSDKETVLRYAIEYEISGIITDQTDIPVRTVAFVADQMGLPGIGYETACLFTDKFLMRERCKELGIPTLAYELVDSIDAAVEFFENIDGDVIIKPVDNQGSRGVFRVSSVGDLVNKFEQASGFSKQGTVLIEQYVTGREFVVEGLAFDYEFGNLICGDTYYFDIEDVFSATTRVFPSTADPKIVDRVLEQNKRIITGFGLKQGITHSEFIMHDGEIYLIETAARGGGVFISSDLISISTGLNTEEFLINIALGRQMNKPEIASRGTVCCYIAFFLPVGEIVSIQGVEEVTRMPFTHRHSLDTLKTGMRTRPFSDKTARNFVIVSADSHEELAERVQLIKDVLKIQVSTELGLAGPIWE
jgi:biotin carboxylase